MYVFHQYASTAELGGYSVLPGARLGKNTWLTLTFWYDFGALQAARCLNDENSSSK